MQQINNHGEARLKHVSPELPSVAGEMVGDLSRAFTSVQAKMYAFYPQEAKAVDDPAPASETVKEAPSQSLVSTVVELDNDSPKQPEQFQPTVTPAVETNPAPSILAPEPYAMPQYLHDSELIDRAALAAQARALTDAAYPTDAPRQGVQ